MSASIVQLRRFRSKEEGEFLEEMLLIEEAGIEGNMFQGGDKQICLFSAEARRWMEAQTVKGLCFKRFTENILTEGLDLKTINVGSVLSIGEAELRVTYSGKRCFDECVLYSNNIYCKLSRCATFLTVEKGGKIAVGDSIYVIP